MSKFKVSGVVQTVQTKVKKTRVGDKTIHYATVDGSEFSTGFKQPFTAGEMVNIVVEHKFGEYQLVPNQVPVNEPLLGSEPPPITSGTPGRARGKFPIDPTDSQMSIIRQNSMNRAVEILIEWGTPNVANGLPIFEAHDEEEYLRKLMEVAMIITDFNSGQDIMQLKAAQQANLQAVNNA